MPYKLTKNQDLMPFAHRRPYHVGDILKLSGSTLITWLNKLGMVGNLTKLREPPKQRKLLVLYPRFMDIFNNFLTKVAFNLFIGFLLIRSHRRIFHLYHLLRKICSYLCL